MSRVSTIKTLPFLADVRKKYLKMEKAFEKVEEIQDSLIGNVSLDSVKVQTALNIHRIENASIALSDAESDLADCINEYLDANMYAFNAIKSLGAAEEIRVVFLRDMRFLSWEQVSKESGFTIQWVTKIYKRAIEKLKIYENKGEII